jgi:hypothetical protein
MRWVLMLWVVVATAQGIGAADECYAPVPCEPEFVAYETKAPAEWAGTVVDEFGSYAVQATRVRRLGAPIAPADVEGVHALGYEIEGVPAPGVRRTFDTRFGRVTGELREARFLFTPATKSVSKAICFTDQAGDKDCLSLTIPPEPPPADAPGWHLCYRFSVAAGSRTPTCLTDQFGERCASLGRTAHVCVPAGLGIIAPSTSATLVCFTAKDSGPQDADVLVHGALETAARPLNLDPADELCVVGTLVP